MLGVAGKFTQANESDAGDCWLIRDCGNGGGGENLGAGFMGAEPGDVNC